MSRICQVFGRDFHRDFMKRHLDAWWLQRPAAVSCRDKRSSGGAGIDAPVQHQQQPRAGIEELMNWQSAGSAGEI
jgi:hypothetical protein